MQEELDKLKVGDIVWGKRYTTEKEKNLICKGHRESPFIVIRRTSKRIYCLECTSNGNKIAKNLKVKISPIFNYSNKETFVFTGKVYLLNKKRYIKKIGLIDKYDLNLLIKYLYFILKSNYKEKIKYINLKNLKIKISSGDLIKFDNNTYYIVDEDFDNYYCYQIKESSKGKMIINNTKYSLNYSGVKKIPINSNFELIDASNIFIIDEIKKLYEIKQNASIGKIIKYQALKYYILEEDNNYFYCYLIYGEYQLGFREITINHNKYYIDLNKVKIDKEESLEVICCASNEEKTQINIINKKISNYDLISYDNELFYIYGEYKNYFLLYKLYDNVSNASKGMHPIKINNKYFFTKFEIKKILKISIIKLLGSANKDEILKIIDFKKKLNYKNKKNVTKNTIYKDYTPKTILINSENLNQYIIFSRNNNIISMLSLDNNKTIIKYNLNDKTIENPYCIVGKMDNYNYVNLINNIKVNI